MGKWTARLEEKTSAPPYGGTDRTDKRGLLSVLAVTTEGGAENFHGLVQADSEISEKRLGTHCQNRQKVTAFIARRERLLRWGWTQQQAEAVAERLTLRDLDADDRRLCVECRHCRPGLTCAAYRAAGVGRELGRDLATLLQRCPAFVPEGGGNGGLL